MSKLRIVLIVLASVAFLTAFLGIISTSASPEKHLSKEEIRAKVSGRLHALVRAAERLRDSVGSDSVYSEALLSGAPVSSLFERLHHLDSIAENTFAEAAGSEMDMNSFLGESLYQFSLPHTTVENLIIMAL